MAPLLTQIKQVADMDGLACKSISSFSRVDHFTLKMVVITHTDVIPWHTLLQYIESMSLPCLVLNCVLD
jgi:hypothetical protein